MRQSQLTLGWKRQMGSSSRIQVLYRYSSLQIGSPSSVGSADSVRAVWVGVQLANFKRPQTSPLLALLTSTFVILRTNNQTNTAEFLSILFIDSTNPDLSPASQWPVHSGNFSFGNHMLQTAVRCALLLLIILLHYQKALFDKLTRLLYRLYSLLIWPFQGLLNLNYMNYLLIVLAHRGRGPAWASTVENNILGLLVYDREGAQAILLSRLSCFVLLY